MSVEKITFKELKSVLHLRRKDMIRMCRLGVAMAILHFDDDKKEHHITFEFAGHIDTKNDLHRELCTVTFKYNGKTYQCQLTGTRYTPDLKKIRDKYLAVFHGKNKVRPSMQMR